MKKIKENKMFDIGMIADTLIEVAGFYEKDLKAAWECYFCYAIKSQVPFEEVMAYIEKKQRQGEELYKADQSMREKGNEKPE